MVVWLASYPRSGSTFFRIVLHELYGYKTYTGFKSGDDVELDTGRRDLTGHARLPASLAQALQSNDEGIFEELRYLHESTDIYFIKSHNSISELESTPYPAILIVRDPRDTFLSFSHYIVHTQRTWKRLKTEIAVAIRSPKSIIIASRVVKNACKTAVVFGFKLLGAEKIIRIILLLAIARSNRWSELYIGWLNRPQGKTALVRFEELINDPIATVSAALQELDISAIPQMCEIPSFTELQQVHPQFFRQGAHGAWRKTMPASIVAQIKSKHGQALKILNYTE